jgi:hypothetical protein
VQWVNFTQPCHNSREISWFRAFVVETPRTHVNVLRYGKARRSVICCSRFSLRVDLRDIGANRTAEENVICWLGKRWRGVLDGMRIASGIPSSFHCAATSVNPELIIDGH